MSNETADASRLAWAATSHGVNSAPIQSALLGYLQASRTYEWHGTNAAEGDDPATAHAIVNLENAVRTQAARPTLGTPASTELLASLDALTHDRRPAWPRPHISSPSFTSPSWSSPGPR